MSFGIVRKEQVPVSFYWGNKLEGGSWSFKPPEFKRVFIDALKAAVPFDYRSYDPDNTLWIVQADYGDEIAEMLEEIFPDSVVVWETGKEE